MDVVCLRDMYSELPESARNGNSNWSIDAHPGALVLRQHGERAERHRPVAAREQQVADDLAVDDHPRASAGAWPAGTSW